MNNETANCCGACYYAGDLHENSHGIPDANTSRCENPGCPCHTLLAKDYSAGRADGLANPQDQSEKGTWRERLEDVLDEHFPKIYEEGKEKRLNKRGAALMLFGQAVIEIKKAEQAAFSRGFKEGQDSERQP